MTTEAEMVQDLEVEDEPHGVEIEVMVQACAELNMNKMSPVDRGTLINTITQGMLAECRKKDMAWIRLGMYWAFIVKNRLYRHYGDHIHNVTQFLKELDLGVKRRELDTYAQMAGLFGRALRERNVEIPIRKLVMIAPLCNGPEADEWLDKAINLPAYALEDEIREAKGLPARDICEHPEERQEIWSRCGVCSRWLHLVEENEHGH